jgi:hypothetical protein
LIIETAFDKSKLQLAKRAGHLCPTLLAAELEKLQRPAEIYISHMKPGLSTLLRFVGIGLQTLSNGSAKLLIGASPRPRTRLDITIDGEVPLCPRTSFSLISGTRWLWIAVVRVRLIGKSI